MSKKRFYDVGTLSLKLDRYLKRSIVLGERGPLRWKSQTNGTPKVQGLFTLRDQEGFPLDMSYEICKENGWDVDWVDILADAARQCIFKFKAVVEEMEMLEPIKAKAAQDIFAIGLMQCHGDSFCEMAKNLYQSMRVSHLQPTNNTGGPHA
jgi:hypothetical protein